MELTSIHYRHQYGNPARPTWGQSYDELCLPFKNRPLYDSIVTESVTMAACNDPDARLDARLFTANYAKRRGGNGIGEQGALELLAKLGMLLNEITSNPK